MSISSTEDLFSLAGDGRGVQGMNKGGVFGRRGMAGVGLAGAAGLLSGPTAGQGGAVPGGDLSRQPPVEVVVELGNADGAHVFGPMRLRFTTGRLYRLVLRNPSPHPHYFTSEGFAASIWTRKAQVMGPDAAGRPRVMAEFKGAIREIEVHPGCAAEWWFVPVQAGRFTDLRCEIRAEDGRSHAEHGMRGEIVIE
jgi:uncharacterized cupredoxin-like copper-binding protein